jgi:hypothetical protein
MTTAPPLYGLLAEFETPEQILEAARQARLAGYRDMDAYAPYAVEGLSNELGLARTQIPFVVLMAGIVGACVGFFMQWYSMGIDYPFNVGGRPVNSWPVWVPVAFEVMVLVASLGCLLGMLFLNGLPRLRHPVFNAPAFDRASQDRFFLCIEATDPKFDLEQTRQFLNNLHPKSLTEVPR